MGRTHVRRRRVGALLVTAGMLAVLAGTARSALGQGSGFIHVMIAARPERVDTAVA